MGQPKILDVHEGLEKAFDKWAGMMERFNEA